MLDDTELKSENRWGYGYSFIEEITEEINPDSEVSGQLVFELPKSKYYDLYFGWGLETVSNEVIWRFDADEAK